MPHDTEVRGLAVRVTSGGARTFVVGTSRNGRSLRMKIASCDHLNVYQAREEARKLLGEITKGVNHAAERRREHTQGTFDQMLSPYVEKLKRERKQSAREVENAFRLHVR
jgi:Arm DNA-binding domain